MVGTEFGNLSLVVGTEFELGDFVCGRGATQVPPLRFASVGMTNLRGMAILWSVVANVGSAVLCAVLVGTEAMRMFA